MAEAPRPWPNGTLRTRDCVVVMGSNMAENHPIAFRFVMQAKEKGATVIHVDPRFTRTSALADIYAPIRTGSDIAFLGGIIHQILERDLWFKEYALNYTNIATIIEEKFRDAEQGDGIFSGWNADKRAYTSRFLAIRGPFRSLLACRTFGQHNRMFGERQSGWTKDRRRRTRRFSIPIASTRS